MKNSTAKILAYTGKVVLVIGLLFIAFGIACIDGNWKVSIICLAIGVLNIFIGGFLNELGYLNINAKEVKNNDKIFHL